MKERSTLKALHERLHEENIPHDCEAFDKATLVEVLKAWDELLFSFWHGMKN